jgi:hypothetical protein
LKFRLRVFTSVIRCRLKLSDIRSVRFHGTRIVWLVGDEPQDSAALENAHDLAQKLCPHDSPDLVAALRPRIRKENVNIIRARFRQLADGLQALTVHNRCIFKPKLANLFSGLFDTLQPPFHTKKV